MVLKLYPLAVILKFQNLLSQVDIISRSPKLPSSSLLINRYLLLWSLCSGYSTGIQRCILHCAHSCRFLHCKFQQNIYPSSNSWFQNTVQLLLKLEENIQVLKSTFIFTSYGVLESTFLTSSFYDSKLYSIIFSMYSTTMQTSYALFQLFPSTLCQLFPSDR